MSVTVDGIGDIGQQNTPAVDWSNSSRYLFYNVRQLATHLVRHPRVGVTKPISSVPLFSDFFSIVKPHVSY